MKRALALAAALSGLAVSSRAEALELGTRATEHPYKSAQNFALEIRFSPYTPQVDDEAGLGGTPYADTFGGGALLLAAELDWQTLRIPGIGTIGPGLGAGIWSKSIDARTVSGRQSGDETGLRIYPFWAVAVFRADTFWRTFGIPFVPYLKAGLGYALWNSSNSGGTAEARDRNGALVKASGGSLGTQLAVGVMFALDAIDPGASRNMDNATGINGTYVFLEGYSLSLNGLGQSDALHVGARTWAAGLAFEF